MTPRLAAGLALAACLAACKTHGPQVEMEVPPVEEPKSATAAPNPATCEPRRIEIRSELDALMGQFSALKNLTPGALKQEFEDARRDFAAKGTEISRLRLAMFYLLPNAPFRNELQAGQLLEPFGRLEGRGNGDARILGQLLLAQVELWKKSEAAIVAQNARLRDEQKKTEELQRKLDAVKDVERAMIQKDQGAKPK